MVIIDFSSKINGHFMFNASILNGLVSSLGQNLKFYSNETNNKIFKFCRQNNIPNFKFNEKNSYLETVTIAFYRSIILNKSKKYILLAFDNSLLPFLFILNAFLLKSRKIELTIILHNNLDTLKKNKFKMILFSLFLKIYKPKIILLSPFMGVEFKKIFKYDHFEAIFHQNYHNFIKQNFPDIKMKKLNKIYISISSSHSKIFLKDKIYKHFSQSKNGETLLVQYVCNNDSLVDNKTLLKKNEKLENEYDYLNYIYNSDYIFFPQDESANMRASGVLVDTLSLGTNFIGPNVGHFKDINMKFGIGILYNNYLELPSILEKLKKEKKTRNNKFLENTKVENLLNAI